MKTIGIHRGPLDGGRPAFRGRVSPNDRIATAARPAFAAKVANFATPHLAPARERRGGHREVRGAHRPRTLRPRVSGGAALSAAGGAVLPAPRARA